MRREHIHKSASLAGASDLTIVAPIRQGLVPSLEAVTYKTRTLRVLRALHIGRSAAHEHAMFRAMSDAVERVGRIQSVRIAVLEPENKVMLAVTFDGAFESYLRVIWQKVASLLDLIFCNTEEYVTGHDHSFEAWGRWLRGRQAETSFLYATPSLSTADQHYLRLHERIERGLAASGAALARIVVPSAEEITWKVIVDSVDPTDVVEDLIDPVPPGRPVGSREGMRQGVQSLVGLFRLAELYPPGTGDGIILHRAARELLPELVRMLPLADYAGAVAHARERFGEQIGWLERDAEPLPAVRVPPPLPESAPPFDAADVQAGIVRAYEGMTDGCLLLVGFDHAAALAAFLQGFAPTCEADAITAGQLVRNLAFTVEGLRLAGLPDAQIDALPEEFVQGMDKRAGVLGDLRGNHPRRWHLPARNWHDGIGADDSQDAETPDRVELSAVHAVVQLRVGAANTAAADGDPTPAQGARARLFAELERLVGGIDGVRPLSLQWMQRFHSERGEVVEHFGFTDGHSQPSIYPAQQGSMYPNRVHLGEILLGHDNEADQAPDAQGQDAESPVAALLRNGSFLVVRKLRQDVRALDRAVDEAAAENPGLDRERVLAKMMGRWPGSHSQSGQPLLPTKGGPNNFSYELDAQGLHCPVHAHIRRANPRSEVPSELAPMPGRRTARLTRRSMPYGPRYVREPAGDEAAERRREADRGKERGLVFMAYNASIGEQFEVVQRWLSGGNSSGGYSNQSDPFLGVPESGRHRSFRFVDGERTVRMALDGAPGLGNEPEPLVRVEWGAYFFAPSLAALAMLRACAAGQYGGPAMPWSAEAGEHEIRHLVYLERTQGAEHAAMAWKAALEDPQAAATFASASLWAAIRQGHGGVLRTPYGVLVADRRLVDEVLLDAQHRYTVAGYLPRMRPSIGEIYLGLDDHGPDSAYASQSQACNAAIQALTLDDAFGLARASARSAVQALVDDARERAHEHEEAHWQLTFDLREIIDPVLADLCEAWFGLVDGAHLRRGGFRWDWQAGDPPRYPGHFTAPSRFIFQPSPGALVKDTGIAHGRALREAMARFIDAQRAAITAPVARAVLGPPETPTPTDQAARTMVGALMGFLPPADGNLRRILNEWLRDGSFWRLRARTPADSLHDRAAAAELLSAPMLQAMQLRPVPELLWRTAVAPHAFGSAAPVDVHAGDVLVLALVSATQQGIEQGRRDAVPVFGGQRDVAPHPTHACPGYRAAMGAMLGFASALVDLPGALRPGPAPLLLSLEGPMPAPDLRARSRMGTPWRAMRRAESLIEVSPLLLTGFGDSWLGLMFDFDFGLSKPIQVGGRYTVDTRLCRGGITLSEMAAHPTFYRKLAQAMLDDKKRPRALLLSGGGNDVHHNGRLTTLLNPKSPGAPLLIGTKVDDFIDRELRDHLVSILDQIKAATDNTVPVLLHGYDHPTPDGRKSGLGGPWLGPTIVGDKGYDVMVEGRAIMATLIDRLNTMMGKVAATYGGMVHHVPLAGLMAADPRFAADHALFWMDELHATTDIGYPLLAEPFLDKLRALGIV